MIEIQGYGCTSAAGEGVQRFFGGLEGGVDHSRAVPAEPRAVGGPFLACTWPTREAGEPVLEKLVAELLRAWNEARERVSLAAEYGVLFASSKGCLEDRVWTEAAPAARDTLTPVLEAFMSRAGLSPRRALAVSNACASSHAALFLASHWIASGLVPQVIVLAADYIGPFVLSGFRALKALSDTRVRPFAKDRDGLRLGDAAACVVVGAGDPGRSGLLLHGVGLDTEGFAATRPQSSGESLARAIRASAGALQSPPDLIVAHATATPANDATEDNVFRRLYPDGTPAITATKWSIGHTLGASGLMDVIAACETMRRGKPFPIATTSDIDPAFRGRYLRAGTPVDGAATDDLLVTSLGFGGVHAAARLTRGRASWH